MVDEREERYDGEEGEYHFSDDQINYDEIETPKLAEVPVASKDSVLDKLSKITPKRRAIIAGVVFIILIGIVYKMLSPSTPPTPNEFAQMNMPANQPSSVVYPTNTTTRPVSKPVQKPPATSVTQMQAPAINNVPPAVAPSINPMNGIPLEQPMMPPPVLPAATQQQPAVSVPAMNVTTITSSSQPKNVEERVATLEQQNAAIMNLLQTEYAQKMSDYEMQGNLVRGKMDEMTKRINRIEASLNQITQLLQQGLGKSPGAAEIIEGPSAPPLRPAGPKMTYNVQAIIPGRAWLKSESGDTVTVAEGDILKDYGRIAKIDPYDGVVEIDTGNKIITLSYGMSVE